MHNRTEVSPQEIQPHRGNGIERFPGDQAERVDHPEPENGKAEDMIALLADRMRHSEARR